MSESANAPIQTGYLPLPATVREAIDLADFLAKSKLVPQAFAESPATILLVLEFGARVGLSPLAALQGTYVDEKGVCALYGTAKMAVVRQHPDFVDCVETPSDNGNTWTCTIKRRHQSDTTRTFTLKMAEQAGLVRKDMNPKAAWSRHQSRMIQHRARGRAMADAFADALAGLGSDYDPGETQEIYDVDVRDIEEMPPPAALPPPPVAVEPAPARRGRPPGSRTRRRAAAAEPQAEAQPAPLPTPAPRAPEAPLPAPPPERQQQLPQPQLTRSPEAMRRTLQSLRDADSPDSLRRIVLPAIEGLDHGSGEYKAIVAQYHATRELLLAPAARAPAPPTVASLQDRQRQRGAE